MSDKIHPYFIREGIHVPNEILTIIMNELGSNVADNDRALAALASCRLASHVLYSLATPLLFSSIQLTECLAPWTNRTDRMEAFKERATKLKQILTTSLIADSVHTLTLRCQRANFENWINGALISDILRRLPHIRIFILGCGGGSLKFTALTRAFASAIRSLCRSPNLTTLDLDNIVHFPSTIITGTGPNLQRLRLSGVGFYPDHPNPIVGTSSLQPYSLHSLEIDVYSMISLDLGIPGSAASDILFAKHFSRIKNLRIQNIFYCYATLKSGWDIMLLASQSLTTLDLPWDDNLYYNTTFPDASGTVPFDLGRLPALRHFKIQILQIRIPENETMLYHLCRLLSTSSSTSGIETLEIMIGWDEVENGSEKDLFSSDAGWSTLDEVLSSEKFVSLQKVVLELRLGKEVCERSRTYYHNQMNLEPESGLAPPYVNSLFSTFRGLTSTQCTLELHVEII